MEKVTLGYVIDNIKVGEVAVKLDGLFGAVEGFEDTHEYIDNGLCINEENGFLSTIDGRIVNGICITPDDSPKDAYIIITKNQYKSLVRRIK